MSSGDRSNTFKKEPPRKPEKPFHELTRDELLQKCRELGTASWNKEEKARYRARIAELDQIAQGRTRTWKYR